MSARGKYKMSSNEQMSFIRHQYNKYNEDLQHKTTEPSNKMYITNLKSKSSTQEESDATVLLPPTRINVINNYNFNNISINKIPQFHTINPKEPDPQKYEVKKLKRKKRKKDKGESSKSINLEDSENEPKSPITGEEEENKSQRKKSNVNNLNSKLWLAYPYLQVVHPNPVAAQRSKSNMRGGINRQMMDTRKEMVDKLFNQLLREESKYRGLNRVVSRKFRSVEKGRNKSRRGMNVLSVNDKTPVSVTATGTIGGSMEADFSCMANMTNEQNTQSPDKDPYLNITKTYDFYADSDDYEVTLNPSSKYNYISTDNPPGVVRINEQLISEKNKTNLELPEVNSNLLSENSPLLSKRREIGSNYLQKVENRNIDQMRGGRHCYSRTLAHLAQQKIRNNPLNDKRDNIVLSETKINKPIFTKDMLDDGTPTSDIKIAKNVPNIKLNNNIIKLRRIGPNDHTRNNHTRNVLPSIRKKSDSFEYERKHNLGYQNKTFDHQPSTSITGSNTKLSINKSQTTNLLSVNDAKLELRKLTEDSCGSTKNDETEKNEAEEDKLQSIMKKPKVPRKAMLKKLMSYNVKNAMQPLEEELKRVQMSNLPKKKNKHVAFADDT